MRKFQQLACIFLFFGNVLTAHCESTFDPALAERLGADELGMKTYMLVILVTGNIKDLSEEQMSKAFEGHFANMSKLASEEKLVVAGPFVDAKPKRGLFILNTSDKEIAKDWVDTDPAVVAGLLKYELYEIYSSAALMLVNETHQKIAQKSIN